MIHINAIDAVITLDKYNRILSVKSNDEYFSESYVTLLALHTNTPVSDIFEINLDKDNGIFYWNLEQFYYEIIRPNEEISFIFIKKTIPDNLILEKMLNTLDDGIQIYDRNANLIYYNNASSTISLKNHNESILGKHLTDIFSHVDEKYSTILTTLQTQSPVINRCDTFKTNSGKVVTTINTAYPIFFDNHLVGSLLIERDYTSIQRNISELSKMQKFIHKQKYNSNPNNTFTQYTFKDLIGNSIQFREAINLAVKVSIQDCNVLIYGETGTGKELFAQSIHNNSKRSNKKFLAINCAAIPENLIEGMLFGTSKGAYTGSVDSTGLFEEANGGTIFLDELNSMSLSLQSKLLRFLQDGTFMRVGGKKNIKCDVRIISSCNEDPFLLTQNNILRKDLFYRISTIIVNIPPLRERDDDIEVLLKYFIDKLGRRYLKNINNISVKVLDILKNYNWPGNVRELMHVVEYVLNTIEGDEVNVQHLPKYLLDSECSEDTEINNNSLDLLNQDLQTIMDDYESKIIKKFLDHNGYNITKTSQALNIKRQSLYYRIKKYGIII